MFSEGENGQEQEKVKQNVGKDEHGDKLVLYDMSWKQKHGYERNPRGLDKSTTRLLCILRSRARARRFVAEKELEMNGDRKTEND